MTTLVPFKKNMLSSAHLQFPTIYIICSLFSFMLRDRNKSKGKN